MAKSTTKETLVDTICKNIRKDITRNELIPGQKLNVKELADRYGTSETPVKLALNRLISEQIVKNFPRQGMRVQSINAEEANEIFDIRLMMDLYYTKEIITTVNLNKNLRDELIKNVQEHLAIVSNRDEEAGIDDYLNYYNYDYKFHELYLKCSGNKKIVDMYKSINPFLYCNYVFQRQTREKDLYGVMEHKAILEAICEQDEELLKKHLRNHIQSAKDSITLILKVNQMM